MRMSVLIVTQKLHAIYRNKHNNNLKMPLWQQYEGLQSSYELWVNYFAALSNIYLEILACNAYRFICRVPPLHRGDGKGHIRAAVRLFVQLSVPKSRYSDKRSRFEHFNTKSVIDSRYELMS